SPAPFSEGLSTHSSGRPPGGTLGKQTLKSIKIVQIEQ
ncbi:MAG: hypothetical protein ACI91T_002240, partial [Natronomonas sp.]